MTYQKGTTFSWEGLTFRMSAVHRLGDGRWKARIYVLDKRSKCISERQILSSVKETFPVFSDRLPLEAEMLAREHADMIINRLLSENVPRLSLESYVALRWERIAASAQWARQAEEYHMLWDARLKDVFGPLSITSCGRPVLEECMETLTHRKRRKIGITEDERKAWIVLDGILTYAIEEGVIVADRSPVSAIARQCRTELSTVARKDLARQSLTEDEQQAVLTICLQRREEGDEYTAILLQYLLGLSVPELCGLSVGDWVRAESADVSWLEITRMYRQTRGKLPVLTALLDHSMPTEKSRVPA